MNTNANETINQTAFYAIHTINYGVLCGSFGTDWIKDHVLNPALALLIRDHPGIAEVIDLTKIYPAPDIRTRCPWEIRIRYTHAGEVDKMIIDYNPKYTDFDCLKLYDRKFRVPPIVKFWGKDPEPIKKFVRWNLSKGLLKDLRMFAGLLKEEMQLFFSKDLPEEEYSPDLLSIYMCWGILTYNLKTEEFTYTTYEELSNPS